LALQRERMYQIGATLADRAHELNTPLSTLLLLSESLAADPGLPAHHRDDAQQIGALAQRISTLLRPAPDTAALDDPPRALSALAAGLALSFRHLSPAPPLRWEGPLGPLLRRRGTWQSVLANHGYNACDAGAEHLDIACAQDGPGQLIPFSDDGPRGGG